MKIMADNQPRLYELTYLLPATLTDAELTQAADEVESLITKHKGKILQTENWGKKALAYMIKYHGQKLAEAHYTFLVVQLKADQVSGLNRDLDLNESLMRHLLVVSDNQDPKKIEATLNVIEKK